MDSDARTARVRAVYESEHLRLWRAVLAYSGSADIADDAVAEGFAQCLRRGGAVRDPAAWVWRASFRIAAGELQRRRRDAGPALPEVGVVMPEPALDLLTALRSLSDQQRACIVLCDLADQPAAIAASLLGTTAATVRVQRMRARRRLRALLEERDA